MFDIGFSELFVIALVGLLVLGPKRLPEVARTAGHWLGKLRRFVADVKQDIDREMQQAELAELRNLKDELDETRRAMEETSGRLLRDANIVPSDETSIAASNPAVSTDSSATAASSTETETKKRPARRRKKSVTPKAEHDRAQ